MASGVAIHRSKSIVATLDLLGQIVEANHVCAGGTGSFSLVALGEHGDADALAGTGRQNHGATNQLVGLLGIHAQIDGDIDQTRQTWRWRFP
jgi:hypothetical protein